MPNDTLRASAGRVLILALNGLDFDRRVLNEARSLTACGFDVTRVGIVAYDDQAEHEETPFGRIVRMNPAWHVPRQRSAADAPQGGDDAGAVRQWGWKVRLMSAVRRAMPSTMRSIDRLRLWRRWNREIGRACRELEADVIIACDLDTVVPAAEYKRHSGCVLVYDAHELWVDQECHVYLTGPFRWWFLRAERNAVQIADLCTTVGRGLAKVIAERHRVVRPLVVYNGPDDVHDPPDAIAEPPSIYFQGSFSLGRGLGEVVDMMSELRGRATLTLQGFGPLAASLKQRVASLGLDDGTVVFAEACPAEQVSACASRYDIGVISVEPLCLNNVLSMPNKVFTYLGGSLALVTTDEAPEIASVVREAGCGIVVPTWTAARLSAALGELLADPSQIVAMRKRAREACDRFEWEGQFAAVVEYLSVHGYGRRQQ